MQLSILIPTHRADLLTCSRLMQACSWANPQVEVIIRDNSGDASKRELLSRFSRDHCNLVFVEPCGPMENYSETLKLARGDFVFFVADDDFGFDRAIAAVPGVIESIGSDHSVAGITGAYAVETSRGTGVVGYKDVDSDDVTVRVNAFLSFNGPNVLIYSPIRRALITRVFDFMNGMPFSLSFHDQLVCLLYLLNGKFLNLKRLLYLYDFGDWETPEKAQKRDLNFYAAANLDPAINKLHWFLCGLEGAVLIRNSDLFPEYQPAQRQSMADRWFSAMFVRFMSSTREAFGSPRADKAEALRAKWKASAGRLSFDDMLTDLCGFLALSSKENSQKYFDFWNPILSRGRKG